MTVWRESFRVRASEMGPDARLRLPALFDLFQEAAGNNAAALGWGSDVLLARGQTWILSRLTLRLLALPAWREDITVETWPAGVHRLWALREFRVVGSERNASSRGRRRAGSSSTSRRSARSGSRPTSWKPRRRRRRD